HALVGGRPNHIRVLGIDSDVDEARLVIDELDDLPCRAAVLGLVDAALGVRFPCRAQCGDVDNIRVGWINRDAPDMLRFLEAHEFPCEPPVGGLIYPAA